jgi:hypothetical protein
MELSAELISQFAKITNDGKSDKKTETTVFGTVKLYDGDFYVQLDGSDLLTPITTTTDVAEGDRVTVMIKNHSATVTGNVSSPSAKSEDVKEVGGKVEEIGKQITEFETVVADKVSTKQLQAEVAKISKLEADYVTVNKTLEANDASIKKLEAEDVTIKGTLDAQNGKITNLETDKLSARDADIKYATIDNLDVTNATIRNLDADFGEFEQLTAQNFTTANAEINNLKTNKLDAKSAEILYANIDFANINMAAVQKLFADSGIIEDLTVKDGAITGELVGVTIKGDLIEGNTVKADKLVVKGSDGLYYKLNFEAGTFTSGEQVPTDSLHGSVITAKSITAEKVKVTDLVAFGATIGGFHITDSALYSGAKASVSNTTRGIYLDNTGQLAFGDSNNFLKFYKDQNGAYRLEISANSLKFSTSSKTIEETFNDVQQDVDSMKDDISNAQTTANNAQNAASGAQTTANNAQNTASGAQTAANKAQTTANNAQTAANNAQNSINNMEIGGRNLFSGYTEEEIRLNDYQSKGGFTQFTNKLTFKPCETVGETYTISFWAKSPNGTTPLTIYNANGDPRHFYFPRTTMTNSLGNEWQYFTYTFTNTDRGESYADTVCNRLEFYAPNQIGVLVKKIKVEKGNKATDWSPAPEDMATSGRLDEVNNTLENVDGRLESVEKTSGDNSKDITDLKGTTDANKTKIEDLVEWCQGENGIGLKFSKFQSEVNEFNEQVSAEREIQVKYIQFEDGNIKLTAEKTTDGSEPFSVIISNTKISFMEGSDEVAYISNKKLYITSAQVKDVMRVGNFETAKRANGNVGTYWVDDI